MYFQWISALCASSMSDLNYIADSYRPAGLVFLSYELCYSTKIFQSLLANVFDDSVIDIDWPATSLDVIFFVKRQPLVTYSKTGRPVMPSGCNNCVLNLWRFTKDIQIGVISCHYEANEMLLIQKPLKNR
jgi:hypothetical protein